jgi:hypothetical protein
MRAGPSMDVKGLCQGLINRDADRRNRCRRNLVMASSGDPLRNELAGDSPLPIPVHGGNRVSMAAGWCSKLLSHWMTRYSPAGAPGRVLVYAAVLTCATVSCRGVYRFDPTCFATGLWGRPPCTIAQPRPSSLHPFRSRRWPTTHPWRFGRAFPVSAGHGRGPKQTAGG